jgi:hypothetical protein
MKIYVVLTNDPDDNPGLVFHSAHATRKAAQMEIDRKLWEAEGMAAEDRLMKRAKARCKYLWTEAVIEEVELL